MITNIDPEILLRIERRKFEKWAVNHLHDGLDRDIDGEYVFSEAKLCWKSWRAALAI